jgi:hypothetical protein
LITIATVNFRSKYNENFITDNADIMLRNVTTGLLTDFMNMIKDTIYALTENYQNVESRTKMKRDLEILGYGLSPLFRILNK